MDLNVFQATHFFLDVRLAGRIVSPRLPLIPKGYMAVITGDLGQGLLSEVYGDGEGRRVIDYISK